MCERTVSGDEARGGAGADSTPHLCLARKVSRAGNCARRGKIEGAAMPAISNGTLISSLFRHVPPTSYSGSLNQPVTLPRYFLTSVHSIM